MRIFNFTWRAALTLLIPVLLLAGWYTWQASQFDITLVKEIPARTILLDRDGIELDTIHGANRRLISSEDIPPFFKDSLLAREDARFMTHWGVSLRGVARAMIRNAKDMDFTQGASTLTMQLARNSYDLREKKSLNRKFLEIAITYRIESHYNKEEILTHYLNRIYFGSGAHGLGEAAQTYFGVPASELNRNQSAMLAGIIRGPHAFSPFRNLDGALKQRDEVLQRLKTTDKIDPGDVLVIRKEPLNLQTDEDALSNSSHAARALRRPLEKALDKTQVTIGGLKITSSINQQIQKDLEQLFDPLSLPDEMQVATVAMEPASGDILGIMGCRGPKASGFNRALDSRRGLGSDVMDPLISTCALERGHVPIKGKPVVTGRHLGEKEAIKLLKRFGFSGKFGTGDDLYRGTMTASLLELAKAYSTIVQNGNRPTERFILRVDEGTHQLISRDIETFPAFSKHATPKKLPKTIVGTSPSRSDIWGIAVSKDLVMMGYDKPQKISFSDDEEEKFHSELLKLLDLES